MSIYHSLPSLFIATDADIHRHTCQPGKYYCDEGEEYAIVHVRAVNGQVGHPAHYPCDPYADFLPPPTPTGDYQPYRAVVFLGPDASYDGRLQVRQRYLRPLLILTGTEYDTTPWIEVEERLRTALLRQRAEAATASGR